MVILYHHLEPLSFKFSIGGTETDLSITLDDVYTFVNIFAFGLLIIVSFYLDLVNPSLRDSTFSQSCLQVVSINLFSSVEEGFNRGEEK